MEAAKAAPASGGDACVVIKEDASLGPSTRSKIRDLKGLVGKRVKVYGWAHNIRKQGASLMFIILRDGTGFLQVILTGKLVSYSLLFRIMCCPLCWR